MIVECYKWLKRMLKREEGMGTIEVVIIIAVLVSLAFIFRGFVLRYFTGIIDGIEDNHSVDSLFGLL